MQAPDIIYSYCGTFFQNNLFKEWKKSFLMLSQITYATFILCKKEMEDLEQYTVSIFWRKITLLVLIFTSFFFNFHLPATILAIHADMSKLAAPTNGMLFNFRKARQWLVDNQNKVIGIVFLCFGKRSIIFPLIP